MKQKKLTGTTVPQFTYDTPYQAENDFYALCAGETPLVMMFLPNFGHPISRAYIIDYIDTLHMLTAGRIACVVRSDPSRIAESLGGAQLPFPLICDVEGVLYDYFDVRETTSIFDWTLAARRVMNAAKKEGYHPKKGEAQLLPLTLVLGEGGKVLYAHRGRSLTDLPEDCEAIQTVCVQLALRLADAAEAAVPKADVTQPAPALADDSTGEHDAVAPLAEPAPDALVEDAVGDIDLTAQTQGTARSSAPNAPAPLAEPAPEPTAPAPAPAPEPDAQPNAFESVKGEETRQKIQLDWFDLPPK